jgi:hypothetical protein
MVSWNGDKFTVFFLFQATNHFGTPPKNSLVSKFLVLKDVEIQSISTLLPDFISFIIIGLGVFVLAKLQSVPMKELNDYPNFIYIYLNNLVLPSIAFFGINSVLFQKKELKRTVKEEILSFVNSFWPG